MAFGTFTTMLALLAAHTGLAGEPAPAPTPAPPGVRTWLDQRQSQLTDQLGGMEISAFADAIRDPGDDGQRGVRFDAAEVDVSGDLSKDLELGLAVVNTPELTKLTVGFLDYHPFGGQIAPRGKILVEKGFHLQVGRFDVPFGNDYQFYASKDSVSISRPLTTTAIMDGGYNDAGMRALGNNGTFNFNAFLLQGFQPGRLVGGRIGLTPFEAPFSLKATRGAKATEVGFSYFYDGTSQWRKRETGMAADADAVAGNYFVRAEYLVRTLQPLPGVGQATTRRGWHLTQEWALPTLLPWPATVFGRVERVTVVAPASPLAALPGDDHDERIATGVSMTFAGTLQLKLEGQHYLAATATTRLAPGYSPTVWLAQCVVVF